MNVESCTTTIYLKPQNNEPLELCRAKDLMCYSEQLELEEKLAEFAVDLELSKDQVDVLATDLFNFYTDGFNPF